ncbi:hypothetical protein [Actinoplanes sp. NPDC049599]|uniref:hypothetical protein n=1 Tax=Actinoplanes sp. NPDC049599 TaxID=3363903 RepID=UPI0037A409F4
MNHVSKLLLVTATATAVASAGTVIAYASWPVPSRPVKVQVRAADMPRGGQPSVARSGADAVVTWSPQEIGPGTTMQSYLVRRHSAGDAAVVEEFGPVAATTFTDTAVPAGKWYWTVTPKFAGWTGDESRKSATLTFTAPATPEPTSLVANTGATRPPAPAATPAGGDPVISPPAPTGTAEPPPAAPALEDEADVPPPVSAEGSPASPSSGTVGDSE